MENQEEKPRKMRKKPGPKPFCVLPRFLRLKYVPRNRAEPSLLGRAWSGHWAVYCPVPSRAAVQHTQAGTGTAPPRLFTQATKCAGGHVPGPTHNVGLGSFGAGLRRLIPKLHA